MTESDKVASKIIRIYESMPRDERCKNIFWPLVSRKRMSDIFEEEAKAIYSETKDDDKAWNQPRFHDIFVPEIARWGNLMRTKNYLGDFLMESFKELEKNNEFLEGVFSPIENQVYAIMKDRKLENDYFRVIHELSLIQMSRAYLGDSQFQEVSDKILAHIMKECYYGEFYTPSQISKLLASIADPRDNMTVLDPFCGTGGLLLECERYANKYSGGHLSLYGQEINDSTWMYCKLSLILNGFKDSIVANEDSILYPAFVENNSLRQFDRVISVPPFGKQKWGYEIAERDQYARFRYGIPPKNSGDFAFLQHMIACLKNSGKGVMVSPEGILFRSGPEARIRKNMVQSDIIEAIILLPSGLFLNTGIPTIITVINMDKPEERRGSILFVSAEREYEETKRQNILSDENIAKIVDAYRIYKDIEKFCRVVNLEEIRDNDYSLNFSLYVDTESEIETVDITQTLQKIRNLKNEREELLEEIGDIINKFDQDE
ncbi:N-6 DNA methylase [Methanosarcina mazei]|nr:N-6 DNA methylase [Methanosarcina mazei]